MSSYLTSSPIDLTPMWLEARASDGAVAAFVGVVRNENEGRETIEIEYQAYGPMAESEMEKIARSIATEWPATHVRMVHRVGRLRVGEASVAIVATSPHRGDAFEACRAAIERIKTTVPIWKKEFHPDGSSDWVDPTAGDR
jgi:molybdopterin synthase catalytic subunit